MQLITAYALESYNDDALLQLFCDVTKTFFRTQPASTERAKVHASMENISRAISTRLR